MVFHVFHVPVHALFPFVFLFPVLFPVHNYLQPSVGGANYSILEVESALVGYSSCALEFCDDF